MGRVRGGRRRRCRAIGRASELGGWRRCGFLCLLGKFPLAWFGEWQSRYMPKTTPLFQTTNPMKADRMRK